MKLTNWIINKWILKHKWSFRDKPTLSPWWWLESMGTVESVNLSSYLNDGGWKWS